MMQKLLSYFTTERRPQFERVNISMQSLIIRSEYRCLGIVLNKMSFTYLSKVLAWFGKYTLELYVLHLFINSLIKSPLFYLDNTKSVIIACVLSIILCMPTQKAINSIIKRF